MKNIFSLFRAFLVVMTLSIAISGPKSIEMGVVCAVTAVLSVASFAFGKMKLQSVAFDTLSIDDARAALTNAIIAVYSERVEATSFLRSFFPSKVSMTRFITIAVRRGTEKKAVDILRGTGSNLVKKKKDSMKTFDPPLYSLASNVNELDIYDIAFASLDPGIMANLTVEQAEILMDMTAQIERAIEQQCADVLQSGIITLSNQDNIVFPRLPESMVDLNTAGGYWTVDSVDPMVALEDAGKFLREKGKVQGGTYNAIMHGDAFSAMKNNPIFQEQQKLITVTLAEIREPQRNSTGASLMGRVSAGAYNFNIWTYPEGYELENGDFHYYIEQGNVIVLPEVTNFFTGYALVPQLPGDSANTSTSGGAFVLREYIDNKHSNHVQEIKSAPVAVPVGIDRIYTFKATA